MDDATQPDFLARAELLSAQGRFVLAEEELRRAIDQDPGNAIAFAVLGLCLAHQEKKEDSIACTDRAVSLSPNEAYVFFARAYVLGHLGRMSEASNCVDQAIRLDSEDPAYWSLKAWISMSCGRWPESCRESARAMELDPMAPHIVSQHALALIRLGEEDAAANLIDSALANGPEDACGHLVNGWYHVRTGDFKQARIHFREAIRLDPVSKEARAGMLFSLKSRARLFRFLIPDGTEVSPEQTMVFLLITALCIFGFVYSISAMDSRFELGAGVVAPMVAVVSAAIYRQLLGPYSNAMVFLTGFGRPLLLHHQVQSLTAAITSLVMAGVFLVPLAFDEHLHPWIPAAAGWVVCGLAASDSFIPVGTLKHLMRVAFAVAMVLILSSAIVCQFAEHEVSSRLWHTLLAVQCAYVLVGIFSFVAKLVRRMKQRKTFARQSA